uniref:Uncharacterized protein n=1 Tax=Amphimedon queenslandica TaxID=400682 RepID=A0A1X7V4C3_AMPQE
MDNINYTPTSQNDHAVAPLFHRAESHNTADPVKLSPSKESLQLSSEYTGNGHETPQETTYSQLRDYSHLAHSGHPSQQLLKAGDQQETVFASTRFYDDIAINNNNDQYSPRVNDTTKLQQSPYQWNVIGKVSHTAILVLILLLLVSIFVMLLYLVRKDSCASGTSNTVSDSAGFASNGNFGTSNLSLLQNKTDHLLDHIAQHDENTAIILRKIITSTTESDSTVDDILLAANQLLALTLDLESCHDINHILPNSPSGYYHLNTDQSIYCNMGELCGEKGGWTRLGYLNMSDPTQDCPSDFENTQNNGIRTCRRNMSKSGCSSVNISANDIEYTQICGRVIGYQKGNTDALFHSSEGIDSYYLDGVSITRGSALREHVWSFIAGQSSNSLLRSSCPCNAGSTVNVPDFIENHYYCESGNNFTQKSQTTFYSDPLWDGKDCLSLESPCCESKTLPWFYRDYNALSASDLELRVCRRGSEDDEDILIAMYEIYVK